MAKIANVKSATHGTTSLTGCREVNFNQNRIVKRSASDAATAYTRVVTLAEITGTVVFDDETGRAAAEAITASGSLIIVAEDAAGSDKTYTFANCHLLGSGGNVPSIDSPAMAGFPVGFVADTVTPS